MYPRQIDELFVLLYLEKLIKKGLFMQVLSQLCMITPFQDTPEESISFQQRAHLRVVPRI